MPCGRELISHAGNTGIGSHSFGACSQFHGGGNGELSTANLTISTGLVSNAVESLHENKRPVDRTSDRG